MPTELPQTPQICWTNSVISLDNSLLWACCSIQNAAYGSEICSESCLWFWKWSQKPPMTCTLEKVDHWKNESLNRYSDATFETIFRICRCFHKENKNFILIFLFNNAAYKYIIYMGMYTKYWFEYQANQNNVHLMTQSLLIYIHINGSREWFRGCRVQTAYSF